MIIEATGSIFDSTAEALVNPVNCVGVMGAGLALEFKGRFPAAFKAYKFACDRGNLGPGGIIVHRTNAYPFVIHLATKDHWRDPSRLAWIETGLQGLARALSGVYRERIHSVAVPALGVGLGGLAWADVRSLIEERLGGLELDVFVYPPRPRGGYTNTSNDAVNSRS